MFLVTDACWDNDGTACYRCNTQNQRINAHDKKVIEYAPELELIAKDLLVGFEAALFKLGHDEDFINNRLRTAKTTLERIPRNV